MNGTAGNANGRQSTADGGLLQGTGAPPRSFSESSASTHDDGRGGISTLSNGHGSYGGVPYSVDNDDDENAGGGGGGGGSGGGGRDRDRGVAREADYSMVSSVRNCNPTCLAFLASAKQHKLLGTRVGAVGWMGAGWVLWCDH